MNIRTGKEVIGSWHEREVIADWDELLRYRGGLRELIQTEKLFGQILRVFSGVGIIIALVLTFTTGKLNLFNLINPQLLSGGITWISLFIFSYAKYLLRDRSEFLNQPQQVIQPDATSALVLSEVLTLQLFLLLDKFLFSNPEDFLVNITTESFSNSDSRQLYKRLGLDATIYEQLKEFEYAPGFWQNYAHLFLGALTASESSERNQIGLGEVVMGMMQGIWRDKLRKLGIQEADVIALQQWMASANSKQKYREIWKRQARINRKSTVNRAYTSVYAVELEKYSEDYTRQAANGVFQLAVGREKQLDELITGLRHPAGNALLLVADPGAGGELLLKHLAVKMVVEDVPVELRDQRLVAFNITKVFTKVKDLAEFKALVQKILEEIIRNKFIVLVLEDFDHLLNMRSDAGTEVVNLIVSYISKYRIPVIATVTSQAYQKYIQPNAVLVGIFHTLKLEPTSISVTQQILIDHVSNLEHKYGVEIEYTAIKQMLDLINKLPADKVLPGKAMDLLEEVCVVAQANQQQIINSDFISQHISRKIGVNVGSLHSDEATKLLSLEDSMHHRVIGQSSAVTAVASALRRARAGLNKSNKPIASFLFYGPTGVGKTEVAKTLAEIYFGDEQAMIRLDMSEFHEQQNMERLVGHQGDGEFTGGLLTEPVRKKPFSLVLLDELEKANPKVLDLLLQVLDDGYLNDGIGRKVDFTNTIIIATSNAASKEIAESILTGMNYDQVYNLTLPKLRDVYRVEFLNRFDKIIMFSPLNQEEVEQVVQKFLRGISGKLAEQGISIELEDNAIKELAKLGYNPIYGARETNRVIQDKLEDKVAAAIVGGQLHSGQKIIFADLEHFHVV